jgi:hypothetical protein
MTVGAVAFEPDLSLWRAWSPGQAVEMLAGVEAPWYVAGGWAIDLFLGGQRREHDDLEIAVPADRFHEVADALAELELFVVTASGRLTALDEARGVLADTHQTWVREPATGWWRLDVFRERSEEDDWVYRRDPRIRRRLDEVLEWTDHGIPYGSPEIVLLFKATRSHEAKHRDDFGAALPLLEPARRGWLAEALAIAHPGHPWIAELERAGT